MHEDTHILGWREEISHEAGRVWVSQWDNVLTDEAWAAEVRRGLGLLPKAEAWIE